MRLWKKIEMAKIAVLGGDYPVHLCRINHQTLKKVPLMGSKILANEQVVLRHLEPNLMLL